MKILLIDDEPATGKILKSLLKDCPCSIFIGQAQRGITGIEMMTDELPGLVIIDLNIPGTSGFDLLVMVKEMYRNTKVVMISNSLKQEYRMIAESLGADYFLDKQTELFRIAEVIKNIVTSSNNYKCDDDTLQNAEYKIQVG